MHLILFLIHVNHSRQSFVSIIHVNHSCQSFMSIMSDQIKRKAKNKNNTYLWSLKLREKKLDVTLES